MDSVDTMNERNDDVDFGLSSGESFEPEELDEPFDVRQPHVMTVLGPVDPADLGVTLAYESVLPGHDLTGAASGDDPGDPARSLAELEDAFSAGVRTVVDGSARFDIGSSDELQWIASRAPVHIIAGARIEISNENANLPEQRLEVAERWRSQADDSVHPGFMRLNCMTEQLGAAAVRAIEVTSVAQQQTGAPLFITARSIGVAREIVQTLDRSGTPMERCVVVPTRQLIQDATLQWFLEKGVNVVLRAMTAKVEESATRNAEIVARYSREGFADQLLLSSGCQEKSRLLAFGGVPGMRCVTERFVLDLMEAGMSGATVRDLLVENPARILTIRTEDPVQCSTVIE